MNTMSTSNTNVSVKTPIKPKPKPRPRPKAKAKAKAKPKPSSPRGPPSTKPHTLEWIVPPPKPLLPFSLTSPPAYRNCYYGSTVVGSKKGGPSSVIKPAPEPAPEPSSAAAAAAFDHVDMECLESYVIDDDVLELLDSDWLNDQLPPPPMGDCWWEDSPLTGIWDY